MECNYGEEKDWKIHFEYLVQFFHDKRYYKIDGKPVFIFFGHNDIQKMKKMTSYWQVLAKKYGFSGIYFIIQKSPLINKHVFKNQFIYYPSAVWGKRRAIERRVRKMFRISNPPKKLELYDYDKCWRRILREAKKYSKKNIYFSGLVRYDDTPRRGKQANIFVGDTSEKFGYYFSKLYKLCCESNKEFVLLTAWNEWGEGAYLEADTTSGYAYLEKVKESKYNK